MNKLQLKELAEKYVFGSGQLNSTEKNALLKSKYRHLFEDVTKPTSNFKQFVDGLYESINTETPTLTPPVEEPRVFKSHVDSSNSFVRRLVRDIEEDFNLDLAHDLYPDYSLIDLDKFRGYIQKYLSNHTVNSQVQKQIEHILKRNSVNIIFTSLINLVRSK